MGADHQANAPPRAAARNAIQALSMSTNCTSRPRPCANRNPEGHLARPCGRFGRHQVGDICGGDQQHKRHEHA